MSRRAPTNTPGKMALSYGRMAPGGSLWSESPVETRWTTVAGVEIEEPEPPPGPYGLYPGPWQASRSGYVCYKNPSTVPDSNAYKITGIPPLYVSGTYNTRPLNLGCRIKPTPGTESINVNDAGSVGQILDARVSGTDTDWNRGLEIFGTNPEYFWAWTPTRDGSFSTHPVDDEWNANTDIVGWEMEDRCVYVEATRLPDGGDGPIYSEWLNEGGYDQWAAYTGAYSDAPADPRAFTDITLSGFTFTSSVQYRGTSFSGFPAGHPITYQLDQAEMSIYTASFGFLHGCPSSVRYTGTNLPNPPTSGANTTANYTVTWAANDRINALYIGWSVSAPSQAVPAANIFSAYALSLTPYDMAPAQVMASVGTAPRWRWLYLDAP